MADSPVHIFGIRHHGPGSARSLREALKGLKPDCILVEGPPDADEVLSFAAHEEMKPPVALLIYDQEKARRAVYYPFAIFSPEWQAIQYGLEAKAPVRFIDLPQSIQMGMAVEAEAKVEAEGEDSTLMALVSGRINQDPLSHLARAAGYSDSERWWEHMVEHRREEEVRPLASSPTREGGGGGKDIFGAVLEAMTALREAAIESSLQQIEPEVEARREAHMRQKIREAEKEGFARIAVVCGAWHAPALTKMPPAKEDAALLKGLPKRKVAATWIPWTYSRLAFASGYGAGIESPGWYDFLWSLKKRDGGRVAVHWLTKVARLLRKEDLDASSASIIEAVRLAESLAAFRGRPLPGLPEMNEATQAVLCFGEPLPLQLISAKLIVSERLGKVPDETPMVPLAQDLAKEQKRLRLPAEELPRQLDLDLRKPNELDRSRLLHRLKLLGVAWGELERHRVATKGTFHELWMLQWEPEFAVALIEAGVWGTTVSHAASSKVQHDADNAPDLPALTALLDSTLLADLREAAEHLMSRLQAVAAVASDVSHLMGALPRLANILRYGNVRQADTAMVSGIVDGLVARICIGLPGACGSLNDEAAEAMFDKILECHGAVTLLQNQEHTAAWNGVLHRLAESPNLHGLIAGRACRLLLEAQQFDADEAAHRLGLALSIANTPTLSAAWVDGFLRNSGLLLLHDETLWNVLDNWVSVLSPEHFTATLPLLRRTFSTFQGAERRQLGSRVASGMSRKAPVTSKVSELDEERANTVLPLLAQLLGLKMEERE